SFATWISVGARWPASVAPRRITGFNDVVAYPDLVVEPHATAAGAIWIDGQRVVTDGTLVSSPPSRSCGKFRTGDDQGFGAIARAASLSGGPPWMTCQIPLKSLFGHRLHGGLLLLPGLRSTGSCPCRSCRRTLLHAGSAQWCLSSRWDCSRGPSLQSPEPVRTSPPTCRPPPSSRADRTASRATRSTSACSLG